MIQWFWRRQKLLKETLGNQGWMQMAGDKSWYQETIVMQVMQIALLIKKVYIEEIDDSSLSP